VLQRRNLSRHQWVDVHRNRVHLLHDRQLTTLHIGGPRPIEFGMIAAICCREIVPCSSTA
jgi:hypothetical protein